MTMQIYTDSPSYARQILMAPTSFKRIESESNLNIPIQISDQLYPNEQFFIGTLPSDHRFKHYFISTHVSFSQYDMLSRYVKSENTTREDILCFAGSGENFHGFRKRHWVTVPGNIHLSVLLNPEKSIQHADTAFLILAANAVTQTINGFKNIKSKAMIHWVNDIVIDYCKVGGVIAQTQIQGQCIEKVILGIGLNVDVSPQLGQDQFVKRATHINKYVSRQPSHLNEVLYRLIKNLDTNYEAILQNRYQDLFDYYIEHSLLIGKHIQIYSDPREGENFKIAEGIVSEITENLELVLDDNREKIRKGRIKFSTSLDY